MSMEKNDQTLLVVDDDPGFLRLMGKVLKREGYNLLFTERGQQAIEICRRSAPDMMLMDLNLPDMEGEALARTCHELSKPVPFIVMTGHGDERIAVRMMKNGALDYVVKDAEFIELIPIVVSQALVRIRQDRALRDAEVQLAQSALRLETAQRIAGMGSFEVCLRTHRCFHGSRSLESLIGFKWQDGQFRWDELFNHCIHEVDRSRVSETFSAFVSDGRDLSIEFRVKPNAVGIEFIQLTGHNLHPDPLTASGPATRLVICRDITERKRLQREILRISGDERQRIGQDIHDGLCQHLAGMEVMVEALLSVEGVRDTPRVSELVLELRKLARKGTQLSRNVAHGLVSYEVDCESWQEAIENLANTLNQQGSIHVTIEVEENLIISSHAVANALFRITQEAIANTRKHANAGHIKVRIFSRPHWLALEISDDGHGFDPGGHAHRSGLGIHLMQYRAETVGGHLSMRSREGAGTVVEARFPIIECRPAASASRSA